LRFISTGECPGEREVVAYHLVPYVTLFGATCLRLQSKMLECWAAFDNLFGVWRIVDSRARNTVCTEPAQNKLRHVVVDTTSYLVY
jgi:hypothetical protein